MGLNTWQNCSWGGNHMARIRMISLDVVDTDKFLEMPVTTRCCYFELLARADDDGFIGNPKKLLRMLNLSEDDLRLLCVKGFVIPFESGVVVITHWKMQNSIRSDRYKPTVYRDEKLLLHQKGNLEYCLLPKKETKNIF